MEMMKMDTCFLGLKKNKLKISYKIDHPKIFTHYSVMNF